MKLVMLGPPGVGKGTQASLIAEKYGIEHYSTGDIFREILKGDSRLSNELEKYVNEGKLVPDTIVFETIRESLSDNFKNGSGWVLDGFPRNKKQAEMLDKLLEDNGNQLDHVIHLTADTDILVKRLSSRRVCSNCGAIYNLEMNPPITEGICDICGGELVQREDDRRDTVKKRISIFEEELKPLLNFYREKNLLLEINGEGNVKGVFKRIQERLKVG